MININGASVFFKKFPNGELNMNTDLNLYEDYINKVVFRYVDDTSLIKLLFVKKYLDSKRLKAELIIAYMPYSRMDRSENGSPFTLKYVTEFINSMKFEKVVVVEPHSDVTTALLDNAVAEYINFSLLPEVLKDMKFDKDRDYLFFPDAGAQKRYQSLKGYNQLVGHKNRDFKTGEIINLELVGHMPSEKSNVQILIVDDLSSYGGTFVRSAEALKELGFGKINLLVAHAENSIFKGALFTEINHLYTTDSLVNEQNYFQNLKFKQQLTIYKMEEYL